MPRILFSLEEGNKRLECAGRTVRLIEAGTLVTSKSTFYCLVCGHQWVSTFNNVGNTGTGCHACSGKQRMDEKSCNNKLQERTLKMLYYAGTTNSVKSKFECTLCGHTWYSSFNNVGNRGRGCAKCACNVKLTEAECHNRLTGRPINMLGYAGTTHSTRSEFRCTECSYIWKSSFNNVHTRGSGCPVCAKSGFNPIEPAWVYRLLLDTVKGACYGFGITNDINDRMSRHRRNLGFILEQEYEPLYFDSGVEAKKLETMWKASPHITSIDVEGFKTECVLVNPETTKMIFI